MPLKMFQVHACVVSFFSNFLRFLVRRAQKQNPEKIQIKYQNYTKKIVKVKCCLSIYIVNYRKIYFQLYMDMIYNVNTIELGINDLLQLIEIVLGEGKEVSILNLKRFLFLYKSF